MTLSWSSVRRLEYCCRLDIPSFTVSWLLFIGSRIYPVQLSLQKEKFPFPTIHWCIFWRDWKWGWSSFHNFDAFCWVPGSNIRPLPYFCISNLLHNEVPVIIFQANLPCNPLIVSAMLLIPNPPSWKGKHTLFQLSQWSLWAPFLFQSKDFIALSILRTTALGTAVHERVWSCKLVRTDFTKVILPAKDKNLAVHPSIFLRIFWMRGSK